MMKRQNLALNVFAAPIHDDEGNVVAALSVSAPADRHDHSGSRKSSCRCCITSSRYPPTKIKATKQPLLIQNLSRLYRAATTRYAALSIPALDPVSIANSGHLTYRIKRWADHYRFVCYASLQRPNNDQLLRCNPFLKRQSPIIASYQCIVLLNWRM